MTINFTFLNSKAIDCNFLSFYKKLIKTKTNIILIKFGNVIARRIKFYSKKYINNN